MTMYFGAPWAAAVAYGGTAYPETPTWARCTRCGEAFADGDQGLIFRTLGPVDAEYLIGLGAHGSTFTGQHRECMLSATTGHLVGVCSCTGWDITQRATSLEVERRVGNGALR